MTDLQGALGGVQLKKLEKFIEQRKKWAEYYINELSSIEWLKLPVHPEHYKHGWQSFVMIVDESKSPMSRNKIMEKLQKEGISTRPGTHAVHMLNYYSKKYFLNPEDFPGAQIANNYSISIPLHNKMEKEDFDYIIYHLKNLV
jgi:dTDP-4-amino-4,6-dideoxygalactose transaminase